MKIKSSLFIAALACFTFHLHADHHTSNSQLEQVEGVWMEQKVSNAEHFSHGFYKVIMGGAHRVLWIKEGILTGLHGGTVSYDGKTLIENPHYGKEGGNFPGKTFKFDVQRQGDAFTQKGIAGSGHFEGLNEKWNKVGDSSHPIEGTWSRLMDNGRVMTKIIVDNFWQWIVVDPATTFVTASLGGTYSYDGNTYIETTHFKFGEAENWKLGQQWKAAAELKGGDLLFHGQNNEGEAFTETWARFKPDAPLYLTANAGNATMQDFHRWSRLHQGLWKAEVVSTIGEDNLGKSNEPYTAHFQYDVIEGGMVGSGRYVGQDKSGVSFTYYDSNQKQITALNLGSDGTVTQSFVVPDGNDWLRETIHTKSNGQQSVLNSTLSIDGDKGVITIIINGNVDGKSLDNQKNIWYRQHR